MISLLQKQQPPLKILPIYRPTRWAHYSIKNWRCSMILSKTENDNALRLQRALVALQQARTKIDALERTRTEPIAIIGMGCRFPGAANPAAFWELLRNGTDAIGEVPAD